MFFRQATLFALASLSLTRAAFPSLALKISGPSTDNGVSSLVITTTLTNMGTDAVKVMDDPNAITTKTPTDSFIITTASGTSPTFIGAIAKYNIDRAVALKAYSILAPGQSITTEHDLSKVYDFSISGLNTYTITSRNSFLVLDGSKILSVSATDAGSHTTLLQGRLGPSNSATVAELATFNGCTAQRQSVIISAASEAQKYATDSSNYCDGHKTGTSRYTTWFGTYADVRHSAVCTHFKNIAGNKFSNFKYDCTCTDAGTYAYVYPNNFGVVYLCGAFWNAPLRGTDSKAGTLVHESSHFTRNGATKDYAYGQKNAKALAKSNPAQAALNADSHEYFAENTPALP